MPNIGHTIDFGVNAAGLTTGVMGQEDGFIKEVLEVSKQVLLLESVANRLKKLNNVGSQEEFDRLSKKIIELMQSDCKLFSEAIERAYNDRKHYLKKGIDHVYNRYGGE